MDAMTVSRKGFHCFTLLRNRLSVFRGPELAGGLHGMSIIQTMCDNGNCWGDLLDNEATEDVLNRISSLVTAGDTR